jgi:P4 family phage/plasmid primase-like protien
MKPISEIARYFNGVKWTHNNISFNAKCPAHDDRRASLTVTARDDKILFHCHAGCNFKDVIKAAGLNMSDVSAKARPTEAGWRDQFKAWYKRSTGKDISDLTEYVYTDRDGHYLYSKIRVEPKDFRVIVHDGNNVTDWSIKDKPLALYNHAALTAFKSSERYPVFVCEGEKDVDRLKGIGLCAVTMGAAGNDIRSFAPDFTGHYVCILPDNDDAGRKMSAACNFALSSYAFAIKSVTVSNDEHGDVSDYLSYNGNGNTDTELLRKIAETPYSYNNFVTTDKNGKVSKINEGILTDVILDTHTLAVGCDGQAEIPYRYDNGVYKMTSRQDLAHIVTHYVPSCYILQGRIRSTADHVISACRSRYNISDFNGSERYINYRNGLYDIKARRLIPHTPNHLSTIQLNAAYDDKADCPRFRRFIDDLCTDDNGAVEAEMVAALQEWIGLALSPIHGYKVKRALVLYSTTGNTGKSVLFNVISNIIGKSNCSSVALQKLGDRFATGTIFDKRINSNGDNDASATINSDLFKMLTGGDMFTAERKGIQSFEAKFYGVMQFSCNDMPRFGDDKGDHLYERLLILHCRNVIDEAERDPLLTEDIMTEADGVARWAREGLHRLIDNRYRFTVVPSGAAFTEHYRQQQDTIREFIAEGCTVTGDPDDFISRADFADAYMEWCKAEGVSGVHRRNIPGRMEKNRIPQFKSNGVRGYGGITLNVSGLSYSEKSVPF